MEAEMEPTFREKMKKLSNLQIIILRYFIICSKIWSTYVPV